MRGPRRLRWLPFPAVEHRATRPPAATRHQAEHSLSEYLPLSPSAPHARKVPGSKILLAPGLMARGAKPGDPMPLDRVAADPGAVDIPGTRPVESMGAAWRVTRTSLRNERADAVARVEGCGGTEHPESHLLGAVAPADVMPALCASPSTSMTCYFAERVVPSRRLFSVRAGTNRPRE